MVCLFIKRTSDFPFITVLHTKGLKEDKLNLVPKSKNGSAIGLSDYTSFIDIYHVNPCFLKFSCFQCHKAAKLHFMFLAQSAVNRWNVLIKRFHHFIDILLCCTTAACFCGKKTPSIEQLFNLLIFPLQQTIQDPLLTFLVLSSCWTRSPKYSPWRRANDRNVSFVISPRWKFDPLSTCLIPNFRLSKI